MTDLSGPLADDPCRLPPLHDRALLAAGAVLKSKRAAIGLSVTDTRDMARAVLDIDAVAQLAGSYFAIRDEMVAAGLAGEVAEEHAADDRLQLAEDLLIKRLAALGYVTIEHAEETSNGTAE